MVECPYCFKNNKISHDDGHGYDEDVLWEEECEHCGKWFVFETYISFTYTGYPAPCLNGEPHKWDKIRGYPEWVFVNKRRCQDCSLEKDIKEGEEEYKIITKEEREL